MGIHRMTMDEASPGHYETELVALKDMLVFASQRAQALGATALVIAIELAIDAARTEITASLDKDQPV